MTVSKAKTTAGKFIEIGSAESSGAVAGKIAITNVIGQDEDDVGFR